MKHVSCSSGLHNVGSSYVLDLKCSVDGQSGLQLLDMATSTGHLRADMQCRPDFTGTYRWVIWPGMQVSPTWNGRKWLNVMMAGLCLPLPPSALLLPAAAPGPEAALASLLTVPPMSASSGASGCSFMASKCSASEALSGLRPSGQRQAW